MGSSHGTSRKGKRGRLKVFQVGERHYDIGNELFKRGLKSVDRILDIGCGWGGFAKYAAEKYKVEVVGITVSKEQVSLGRELCLGLPVEISLQDYRDLDEKFDHIVSVGVFEHVGYKNYRTYSIISRSGNVSN